MKLLLLLLLLQCAELCAAYRLRVPTGQGPFLVLPRGPPCGSTASPAAPCGGPSRIKGRLLPAFNSPLLACLRSPFSAAAKAEAAAPTAVPDPADYSVEWELGTSGSSTEALSPAAQPAAEAAALDDVPVGGTDSRNSKTSSSRMRLTLTLSNNHVYACITDKSRQRTFAFASSRDKCLRDSLPTVKRKRGKTTAMPAVATVATRAAVALVCC
ncbi:hypothetical protein Esti_003063 [Eimeria stiedai]